MSSADFCAWSGLGITAYNSAFEELREQGYLIPKDSSKPKESRFTFYDKSRLADEEEETIIEIPEEKVKETNRITEMINNSKCGNSFVF